MTLAPRAALRRAALVLLAVAAYGAWALRDTVAEGITGYHYSSLNIFFHLFARLEPLPLVALALTAVAAWWLAREGSGVAGDGAASEAAPSDGTPGAWTTTDQRRLLALCAAVVIGSWAIQQLVMHGLAFSMDEFNTGFQATILARGRVFEPVREAWIGFVPAIKPVFVAWRGSDHTWYSGYIPVYAALRAALSLVHAEAWLNPLCAGAAVWLVAHLARRLRPDEARAPWVAALLLATSAQFLLTSGSQYTMPAHLAANLAWLALVLRGGPVALGAAALLGGLALGLHNPFPHGLFVIPFFVRWLRERRWARLVGVGAVYLAFAWAWLSWLRMERGGEPGQGGGLLSLFALPGLDGWRLTGMNLVLALDWQVGALALLVIVAFLREDRLSAPERDLAGGVLLTFLFYVLYGSSQGHGWGYRYVYGVLGSLALLAAAAAPVAVEALGAARARAAWRASLAVGAVVLAVRVAQVERVVGPFAEAVAYVGSRDADVVAVEASAVWYGRDLVRNDAALSRPVVVNGSMLNGNGWGALRAQYGSRLVLLPADSLVAHGMVRVVPRPRPQPAPAPASPPAR